MNDQVDKLNDLGVDASQVNSGLTSRDESAAMDGIGDSAPQAPAGAGSHRHGRPREVADDIARQLQLQDLASTDLASPDLDIISTGSIGRTCATRLTRSRLGTIATRRSAAPTTARARRISFRHALNF